MEIGPQSKVSADRLVKSGIKPAIPGLQGERFIYYTMAVPMLRLIDKNLNKILNLCFVLIKASDLVGI